MAPKVMDGIKVDRFSASVIMLYVCQMEGRPTIKEATETMNTKLGVTITEKQAEMAAKALQKRGLLSVNYDTHETGMVIRYSVRDVKFSKPPEIAHVKASISVLFDSPETQQIKNILEGIHETGDRKGKLPDIRDYARYSVTLKVVTSMLGGEPMSDKHFGFRRLDGSIWIPMNLWLRAALKIKLRMNNVAESRVQYIEVTDVIIPEKSKVIENRNVIGIAGPQTHESVKTGSLLQFEIAFPTTGFGITEKQFLKCLDGVRIGAKHKEYGLMKVETAEKIEL